MYRIGKEEIEAVAKAIETGSLFKVNDKQRNAENFEKEACEKFDVKHVILMTSGKASLISALTAMGIGPGDQVIVPGYTYIATAIAVTAVGAIPVIAEVDETLTLDAKDVEKKITPATKAVIPVHIQGFPCNMDALKEVAAKHNLMILEDACQADGGSYKGQRLGTIGDAGALSFNYFKIITAGESGALMTNNDIIFQRAMIYHDSSAIAYFGNQLENFEEQLFCGVEYRTNDISAAILREQLKKLDGILEDLRKNKKAVMEALKDDFKFIPSNDAEGDCGTTIAFRFDSEAEARKFAEAEGINGTLPIDTGKHVYPNWQPIMEKRGAFHPAMDPFKMEANKDIVPEYTKDMCPATLDWLSRTVYLSVSPDWTQEQLDAVVAKCKNAK